MRLCQGNLVRTVVLYRVRTIRVLVTDKRVEARVGEQPLYKHLVPGADKVQVAPLADVVPVHRAILSIVRKDVKLLVETEKVILNLEHTIVVAVIIERVEVVEGALVPAL